MSGFTPWRGMRSPALTPVPGPPEPDDVMQLRLLLRKERSEKATLTQQLRDTARERDRLQLQVRSGATMLAAAKRQCAAGCEHAAERDDWKRLATALDVRLAEVQAANEGHERLGFTVPRQRKGGAG